MTDDPLAARAVGPDPLDSIPPLPIARREALPVHSKPESDSARIRPAPASAACGTDAEPGEVGAITAVEHARPSTLAAQPEAARALRRRCRTLVELLDDPSTTVWTQVRRELERLGRAADAPLRMACDAASPLLRSRARALLLARGRKSVVRRLISFAGRREINLESGLFLLARLERPELDVRPYLMQFDALAAEVLRRIESRPPTLERAMALVSYLGQEIGLRGDTGDYHHPDNIYLHRALERRRGMPLTLAAIYQSVGRRAGIQSALVPLPGHVMLRVRGGGKSALVDVFEGGEQRTERDLLRLLAANKLPFQPNWFRDADDASMFQRQVNNLKNSYVERGLLREARGLKLVLTVLERRASLLARGARV